MVVRGDEKPIGFLVVALVPCCPRIACGGFAGEGLKLRAKSRRAVTQQRRAGSRLSLDDRLCRFRTQLIIQQHRRMDSCAQMTDRIRGDYRYIIAAQRRCTHQYACCGKELSPIHVVSHQLPEPILCPMVRVRQQSVQTCLMGDTHWHRGASLPEADRSLTATQSLREGVLRQPARSPKRLHISTSPHRHARHRAPCRFHWYRLVDPALALPSTENPLPATLDMSSEPKKLLAEQITRMRGRSRRTRCLSPVANARPGCGVHQLSIQDATSIFRLRGYVYGFAKKGQAHTDGGVSLLPEGV